MTTEKQTVHDWSSGELVTYEIEAEIVDPGTPPPCEPTPQLLAPDETPSSS